ncbi:hypothetical protein [Streptomyces noursei]|uniref:hypothetical protein n=1 Tax=Streptomyces noursei TaxID=1971 RepID=UPI001679146A|nr:hypothetical protein [Streptomyces noursei]MCZ1013994.1 hypothetical protein [Streptomyces noursei]
MPWNPQLTEHETAVLRLLARGHTHAEIAGMLRVRPETLGELIYQVRISLRARTTAHAVAVGYETGILVPGAGGSRGDVDVSRGS